MRQVILATVLVLMLCSMSVASDKDVTLETDKIAHFGVGGVISAVTYRNFFTKKVQVAGQSFTIGHRNGRLKAFLVTVIAGYLKEVYDSRQSNTPGKKFDVRDMIATDLGGLVVLVKW